MINFPEIPPNDKREKSVRRLTQKDILPTAIKNRLLGNIVQLTNTVTASIVLNNGEDAFFIMTTSAVTGARLICAGDVSLFVNSIDAQNQLPSGTNVDESKWQVIFIPNDWGNTDNFNNKYLVYVRNISAGTVTVYFVGQGRVIVNTAVV